MTEKDYSEGYVKLGVGIAIIVMYFLVSNLDYQDQKLAEQQYIKNVCAGVHPNYKKWEIDCKN